jgi:enediyne biosynthesis protein E7
MSDKELIDEVMTLIVAGHETTAAALTWTWYLISQHPDARRSCRPRPTARPISPGARRRRVADFTHQVVQEALRLYPPGWLFTRRTIEADELGGFPIAPRTDVFISPYMLHRHPAFWSEPEEFSPSASRAPMPRSAIASPTFPSRSARGTASARTWPCSRCWCTCRPCRALSPDPRGR